MVGLHACGAAYDVEVFSEQKAYEVTAKVCMALQVYSTYKLDNKQQRLSCSSLIAALVYSPRRQGGVRLAQYRVGKSRP